MRLPVLPTAVAVPTLWWEILWLVESHVEIICVGRLKIGIEKWKYFVDTVPSLRCYGNFSLLQKHGFCELASWTKCGYSYQEKSYWYVYWPCHTKCNFENSFIISVILISYLLNGFGIYPFQLNHFIHIMMTSCHGNVFLTHHKPPMMRSFECFISYHPE